MRRLLVVLVLAGVPAQERLPDLPTLEQPESLRRVAEAFRLAVERVEPSVVLIQTIGGTQPVDEVTGRPVRPRFLVADGPTTGVVYRRDGLIVTSSFNFVRDPSVITVRLSDGRSFVARLLGRDRVRKIALLKIEADDLPEPQWAEAAEVRVGQFAMTLGYGEGAERPAVSVGMVSAVNRMAGSAIQTDARLSPGNYGGPLIDLQGRVVGICVPLGLMPGELAGVEWYDAGIGFAIPRETLEPIVRRLEQGESIERGFIGVTLGSDPLPGVLVTGVAGRSPAEAAGIRPGDRVVAIDGEEVNSFEQLMRRMNLRAAGEMIHLRLLHEGQVRDVVLTLAPRSELDFDQGVPPPPEDGD